MRFRYFLDHFSACENDALAIAARNTDIGILRFTRSVHHAAHHGYAQRLRHAGKALFNLLGKCYEIYQKIRRKNISIRALNYLSIGGMCLFMAFFVFMLNQDVQRFIFGNWG